MSAAIMDTDNYVLSGVINVEQVQNPIIVADQLGDATHTMLAGAHATAFARSQGIEEFDVVTRHRRQEWEDGLTGRTGTVGAVALDDNGVLCAATSTGGVGHETAGRVSDAPTVAGTYACDAVGISCTGVGEEIVNQAVAVRIATRALTERISSPLRLERSARVTSTGTGMASLPWTQAAITSLAKLPR